MTVSRTRNGDYGTDESRAILSARMTTLIERLPSQVVRAALQSDDMGAFITLASPEAWVDAPLSPMDRARLRGVERKQSLLEESGYMTATNAAEILGVTKEAVRKRVRGGTLIGMKVGARLAIPSVQFADRAVVPGLSAVLSAMSIHNPWMRLEWLLAPEPRLDDQTPIGVLKAGNDQERVVGAARMVGLHGAA